MFKQLCFFRKRADMSMDEFLDYYENQHTQLAKKMGAKPALPNAVRYVRRYLTPERNPVTGEIHDSGYDCLMEIWWNSREDFEASQRIISDPARLPMTMADEKSCLPATQIQSARLSTMILRWAPMAKRRASICDTAIERINA